MKQLTGADIITIIKSASKNFDVIKEAQNLTMSDFDTDDITVRFFFNALPEGFKSASIQNENVRVSIIYTLEKIKNEIESYALRKAHNLLQNINTPENEAVILENTVNENNITSQLESQIKCAQIVKFLSKYASNSNTKRVLAQTYKDINSGNLKLASESIHKVYSNSQPNQNIKTAFVTLKNQVGEGYQLCPKGIYIWGQPRPMAISNCREYCIDSRLHPDGTVSCNYLKWLNDNLITQEQAKNLFDTIKVDQVTMNLDKGERTKFPMSDQNSLDTHVRRSDETVNESWEKQLSKVHEQDRNKKPQNTKVISSDTAIEMLLKDVRDQFDDDELDVLEEQLRKSMGE